MRRSVIASKSVSSRGPLLAEVSRRSTTEIWISKLYLGLLALVGRLAAVARIAASIRSVTASLLGAAW